MKFTALEGDGERVAIRLQNDRNTEQVYWSAQYNSYVVVESPTGYFTAEDGTRCDLVSINGAGEIRWAVTSVGGNTSGDLEAARYFGLTWIGWRPSAED